MKDIQRHLVLNAVTATGTGSLADVRGYNFINIWIIASGVTTGGTIKIKTGMFLGKSDLSTAPLDFSSAASATNIWSYAETKNKNNDAQIVGSTGLSITANGVYHLTLNDDNVDAITAELSARTDGTYTVYVLAKKE